MWDELMSLTEFRHLTANSSILKNPFTQWLEANKARTNSLIDPLTIVHRN